MFCTKAVFGLTAILYSVVISDAYAEQLEIPASLGLEQQGAKLLILGTFHFKDAGLDGYKPQHEVDIFAPERQQELNDILDRLEAYAPTRIAVEMNRSRQDVLDERYSRYLDGEFKLSSNEIYQLGFRLGKRLGHKQLYAVDAQARHYEPRVDPAEFAQQNSQQWLLDDSWHERFMQLYAWEDKQKLGTTLQQFLLFLNSPERVRLGHGHYLVGGFKAATAEAYPGADNLSGWWYNRNLRIFANVLQLVRDADERVLLIIGAGHLPILHHAATTSPEVTLVDVADVLGKRRVGLTPGRSFANGVFVSDADPAMKVRIAPGFEYLGQDHFLLGDRETHAVERHHWVRTSRDRVTAMIIFQFEQIRPGVPGQYEFSIPPAKFIAGGNYRFTPDRVLLGEHRFVHNTWAFDTRRSAADNPGKESAHTLQLLQRHGYEIDDGLIMSRYVTEVGDERRRELILFYTEPLAAHGHSLADFPDDSPPSDRYDELSRKLIARGSESFEVLPPRNKVSGTD